MSVADITETGESNIHDEPVRAVLCYQVSTEEQKKHGFSIDDQERALRGYRSEHGMNTESRSSRRSTRRASQVVTRTARASGACGSSAARCR